MGQECKTASEPGSLRKKQVTYVTYICWEYWWGGSGLFSLDAVKMTVSASSGNYRVYQRISSMLPRSQ